MQSTANDPRAIIVRPSVVATFPDQRALAVDFLSLGQWGGLFVKGQTKLGIGTELDIEIVLLDRKIMLHTRGMVRWRRTSNTPKTPAGMGVEFLESEQQAARMIRTLVDTQDPPRLILRGRRYPAIVSLAYARDRNQPFVPCVTDDISRDGAFLLLGDEVTVGDMLHLRVWHANNENPNEMRAKVIWRGGRGSRRGVGVRFEVQDPGIATILAEMIDSISRQVPPLPEGIAQIAGA